MKRRRPAPSEMHPCAAANCTRRCQLRHLMCWIHWCQVPRALQAKVYATCAAANRDHDEQRHYLAAVAEAVEIVAVKDMKRAGLLQ